MSGKRRTFFVEAENEAFRAELAATRSLLEELLNAQDNEVRELKDRMTDPDRGPLDGFPREVVQPGDEQPNRRRYSE
jgi:hypothetical protein